MLARNNNYIFEGGIPCDDVANVLDYNTIVSEFEFQSHY